MPRIILALLLAVPLLTAPLLAQRNNPPNWFVIIVRMAADIQSLKAGAYLTHPTDCTAATATRVGQRCHELDDGTDWVWDGASWNPLVDESNLYSSPTELTLSAGSVTMMAGGGACLIATESGAATDTLTGMVCAAGESWSCRAASDDRDIVIASASIPTPTGLDMTLNQDGDLILGMCQTANTPEVFLFLDEDGEHFYRDLLGGAAVAGASTRPPGSDRIALSTSPDACQDLTDGVFGETCFQLDNRIRYTCVAVDQKCDQPSEWVMAASF